MRPLHESVAKEKMTKILLIEAENEANNELLANFSTKSSEILAVFIRHLIRAKVSSYISFWFTVTDLTSLQLLQASCNTFSFSSFCGLFNKISTSIFPSI